MGYLKSCLHMARYDAGDIPVPLENLCSNKKNRKRKWSREGFTDEAHIFVVKKSAAPCWRSNIKHAWKSVEIWVPVLPSRPVSDKAQASGWRWTQGYPHTSQPFCQGAVQITGIQCISDDFRRHAFANLAAALYVRSEVSFVRITSTSCITSTGLKKCNPQNAAGFT